VTRNRARKKAIRARMDASGEPYSTAARKLDAAGPALAPVTAGEIIARVNSTLTSPRARIEIRMDRDIDWVPGRQERDRPGPAGRLATFAGEAVWKLIFKQQRFMHLAGEGFIEPAASRYQIDFGGYAMMHFNGQHYSGAPGRQLRSRHRTENPSENPFEPLEVLGKLRDVTDARQIGHETVRGTPCRAIAVRAGSAEFTVCIDDEHVRRIQTEDSITGERASTSTRYTLELWDFGAEDGPADWTHLPSFRTAARAGA
jgi:hypothetical protein